MKDGTEKLNKERLYGPDAAKCMAIVLVFAVHFFLNTGFYDQPLQGGVMALATWLRMLFMVCVPMFMMLTGFLSAGRRVRDGWLRGLWYAVAVWIVSSAICLLFRRFRLGEVFHLRGVLSALVNYSAVPYGWYVEMYIGLYLLSPLLAAAWSAMDGRGKRAAVISLLVMTALPTVMPFLPQWWTGIYPVTYFVLGAWLRERPLPKVRGAYLLLAWAVFAGAAAALRWYFAHGDVFTWAAYADWGSIFVTAESVCAFALLIRCTGERTPRAVRAGVRSAARLTLPLYLSSFIADSLLYPVLFRFADTMAVRLPFLPLMTAGVVICSWCIAWVTDVIARALMQLLPQKKPEYES